MRDHRRKLGKKTDDEVILRQTSWPQPNYPSCPTNFHLERACAGIEKKNCDFKLTRGDSKGKTNAHSRKEGRKKTQTKPK